MTSPIPRAPLTTPDLAADTRAALRDLLPGAFADGQLDLDALRAALGDDLPLTGGGTAKERFGLSWPGKADAQRLAQSPSAATLRPDRDASVDFDTTKNLIIEGDNLEVLKLLQRSYHGRVKMIYIDPPYNTGNDFIYPDDFKQPLDAYLRLTGQTGEGGAKLTTNPESAGRYHSAWLSMMLPRLALARNLLRDDGVIFVSIGDQEIHNLRGLMDGVLGEENFFGVAARISKKTSNKGTYFAPSKDYVVCFAKSLDRIAPLTDEADESYADRFDGMDERGRFATVGLYQAALDARPNQRYWIECPDGTFCIPPGDLLPEGVSDGSYVVPQSKSEKVWRWSFKSYAEKKHLLVFKRSSKSPLIQPDRTPSPWNVYTKYYLEDRLSDGIRPRDYIDDCTNDLGTADLKALGLDDVFAFAKPVKLIARLDRWVGNKDDIVLDFFAGSGTTAHAVMKLNAEDGGNRRFVLVQLPEPLDEPKRLADGTELRTIADICRERVRRSGHQLDASRNGKLPLDGQGTHAPDVGFRAYRLDASNFLPWDGDPAAPNGVARQIALAADNLRPGRGQDDLLTELLLKRGFDLAEPVARRDLAGHPVYDVGDGLMLVCLDAPLTLPLFDAVAALPSPPEQLVCLDTAFPDDRLKVNAWETIQSANRHRDASIEFLVV